MDTLQTEGEKAIKFLLWIQIFEFSQASELPVKQNHKTIYSPVGTLVTHVQIEYLSRNYNENASVRLWDTHFMWKGQR